VNAADDEDELLRSVTLQNAQSIQLARQRVEEELRQAKDALQARERELSLIYGNVSDVIFYLAAEPGGGFRFASVNRAFLTTTGLSEDQVVGRRVEEVIPEPSLSLVLDKYATAIREAQTVRWEETTRYPTGDRVGEVSVTPIFDAGGACTHLIGAVHDVTERKQSEGARYRLAAVVESSDDAILSKTLEGIITTWNKGAERLFGYTADEVVGKSVTILIPPDRLDEETVILGRLRRGERIEHYETIRMRKDRSLLDVSLAVSPIRDSTGRIIGASKIARDITERRQAEEALRDETRVLELLNSTGTAIASNLDLKSLVQTVTDAGTKLSGAEFGAFFYNVTDERGESYVLFTLSGVPREAFEKFGLPRNTPVFNATFRGEGVVRSADITSDPRYGQMAPHHGMPKGHLPVRSYLAASVTSRSGKIIGGLFFGHQKANVFTERAERLIVGVAAQAAIAIDNARLYDDVRRAAAERERLLEAERAARADAERVSLMKDEFLATLSHELRTPLNAILGWAHLLTSSEGGSEDLKQGLEIISRNARAQSQLVEDLLDMSRIVSGNVRLDVRWADLVSVIDAAVDAVRPSAEAKGIRLQKILDPSAESIFGDPARLQQVVWNLVSNAVKFTPRGGKIEVILARVNSHIEIRVNDSGLGIRPEFLPHVFERFRQADSSSTRRYGGLGLGLAIVKQLVELHGGSVRAYSEGEGRGASFVVNLPLSPVRVEPQPPAQGTTQGKPLALDREEVDLTGVKILVVDDEPDARDLIKRVLAMHNAEVITASSAAEGLELLQSARPDVLVSDIGMPEQDGYHFIRAVRKLPASAGGRIPAVALTAFARSEDRTRAMIAGYQIHLSKPIEPRELLVTVGSLGGRMQGGGAGTEASGQTRTSA
jgi:PAS domain S-box-containing protein